MAFSADGRLLASGSADETVCVWDVQKHVLLWRLRGADAAVHRVAFTPDAGLVLGGSANGRITVWSVANGRPVAQMVGGREPASAMAVSPDGLHVASAGPEGAVRVWDLQTYRLKYQSKADLGPLTSLFYMDGGRRFAVADYNQGRICAMEASDGAQVESFPIALWAPTDAFGNRRLARVVCSADGTRIAAAFSDGQVARGERWPPLSLRHTGWRPQGSVIWGGIDFRGAGRDLICVSQEGLSLWGDDGQQRQIASFPFRGFGKVRAGASSPDGATVAVAVDTTIRLYRIP